MRKEKEVDFFKWVVSLFKKKKEEILVVPSKEEREAEAKRKILRSKYRIDKPLGVNALYIQYNYNNAWWYIRRNYEDSSVENIVFGGAEREVNYTLEHNHFNCIKINSDFHAEKELNAVIDEHQKWIDDGHIFMSLDN